MLKNATAWFAVVVCCGCGRIGYDSLVDPDAGPGPLVLGPQNRITVASASSSNPAIVWTGSEFGLAWYDNRNGASEIYFARMDAAGNKIGNDVRVSNAAGNSRDAAIAWSGTEYGIAWQDNRDGASEVYFARVDAGGGRQGPEVRATIDAGLDLEILLASTGTDFFAAWQDSRSGQENAYVTRIDPTGVVINAPIPLTTRGSDPWLVAVGNELAVAWRDLRDGSDIYFARLDGTGTMIGSEARVTDSGDGRRPGLAVAGEGFGVTYTDDLPLGREVHFKYLDGNGNPITGAIQISNGANNVTTPQLGYSAGRFLIVWREGLAPQRGVRFVRITEAGAVVDAGDLEDGVDASDAAITGFDNGFAATWEDNRDGSNEIYSRLLTQ